MSFWESIKQEFTDRAEKKKEDADLIHRLRLEAEVERRRIFELEFKKNALEVAKSKAKEEAAESSGLKKMRSMNRLRNLEKVEGQPQNMFEKLGEFTRRNVARREENMKRTAEMRAIAGEGKAKSTESPTFRKPFEGKQLVPVTNRKAFGSSTWKM